MRRGQTRAGAYLEAVAFLIFTGQEDVARAFLEAAHPELAKACREEASAYRRMLHLSGEALCLVADPPPPPGGDTGSAGSKP